MDSLLKKLILIKSLDELSPRELAKLLQLLIKCEFRPGGPYIFGPSVDEIFLNNHIYWLFAAKGKKLNPIMATNSPTTELKNKVLTDKTHNLKINPNYEIISQEIDVLLTPSNKKMVRKIINKVQLSDYNGEISNLTDVFYQSLKYKVRTSVAYNENLQAEYSVANIYTWITYSLIDAQLDKKFSPDTLPLISILQRKIISHYLKSGMEFKFLESIFQTVDIANINELNLRDRLKIDLKENTIIIETLEFPNIDFLMFQKSIAHTAAPIALTSTIDDGYVKDVERAMRLYCSSRQLNDDLHDWVEDFSNGQVTYVITEILSTMNIKVGRHSYTETLEKMKNAYWEHVLSNCCNKIKYDIEEAISLLENTILQKNSKFITSFLKPISDSANHALSQNNFEKDFIKEL